MYEYPFPRRLLFTGSFFDWLEKSDYDYGNTMFKLIMIKNKSLDHKNAHNVMIDTEFDKTKNALSSEKYTVFKGAITRFDQPDFIKDGDYLSYEDKIVKLGIHLTEEKPFRTHILTDKALENKIKENEHFLTITSVDAVSEDKAIGIINEYDYFWKNYRKENRI